MEIRHMGNWNPISTKTHADNHVVWRVVTRTVAFLRQFPHSRHTEHHPAARRRKNMNKEKLAVAYYEVCHLVGR